MLQVTQVILVGLKYAVQCHKNGLLKFGIFRFQIENCYSVLSWFPREYCPSRWLIVANNRIVQRHRDRKRKIYKGCQISGNPGPNLFMPNFFEFAFVIRYRLQFQKDCKSQTSALSRPESMDS